MVYGDMLVTTLEGYRAYGAMRYLSVLREIFQVSLKRFFAYRAAALLILLFEALFVFAEVVAISVYYLYGKDINGWGFGEMLVLLGSFNLIVYTYQFFSVSAHESLVERVVEGDLDYDLLRPIDSQFLVSVRHLDYPSAISLLLPVSLLALGASHAQFASSPLSYLLFAVSIVAGTIVLYSVTHMCVCLGFWLDNADSLSGLPEYLFTLASRPRGIYPIPIQIAVGFVLPLLLATEVPARALLGNSTALHVGFLLGGAAVMFTMSRVVWRKAVARYRSTS